MPFYSRFVCGVLRAFSVETLPCLDIFDLTICGMGLFVRPISREVGVVDFREMFKGCSSLEDLNILSFDTRNASMMDSMFDGCDGLSIVRLGKNFYFTNESGRMCSLPDGYWCQERTHKFYNAIDVPDGVDSIYTRGIRAVESHWEQDANGWW